MKQQVKNDEDMDGRIDYFVCGAGSGGIEGCYDIEGIGNEFIPNTMEMDLVNEVIKVNDKEAYDMVKLLALKEGVIVGSSSGAAMVATLKLADKINKGNIVTIFPDRGDRYFSKNIY